MTSVGDPARSTDTRESGQQADSARPDLLGNGSGAGDVLETSTGAGCGMKSLIERANLGSPGRLLLERSDELLGPRAAALFSPPDPETGERAYRYTLTREWDVAKPLAVFVMLNPSTADAFRTDPTITRCRNFAHAWGCGGLVVLNAFALRSTDPKVLRGHPDPVGPDNDQVIAAVLRAGNTGPVVLAWGANETLRRSGRDTALVTLLHAGGIEPMCLGKAKSGSPRHPLYLRSDAMPEPYADPAACGVATNR